MSVQNPEFFITVLRICNIEFVILHLHSFRKVGGGKVKKTER